MVRAVRVAERRSLDDEGARLERLIPIQRKKKDVCRGWRWLAGQGRVEEAESC